MKFFCCLFSWARIFARRFSAIALALRLSLTIPPLSLGGLLLDLAWAAGVSSTVVVVAVAVILLNLLAFRACP